METSNSNELFISCNTVASQLFTAAQETVIYRPSVTYLLQNVKEFFTAMQKFKNTELNKLESRALERFIYLSNEFLDLIRQISKNWMNDVLNVSCTQAHETIDRMRKNLIEIAQQLGLDPNKIIKYDPEQDKVNKIADLQYYKAILRGARAKSIDIQNAVDIQQIIGERMHSINSHLPANAKHHKHVNADAAPEEFDGDTSAPRMEVVLRQFKNINIPVEDIKLEDSLGVGGFGTVYKGTRLSTGEILAVKESKEDEISSKSLATLYAEVSTMAPIRHRYILELAGAHITKPYRIITRYCPGLSLFTRLHRPMLKPMSPDQLMSIAYQVAKGMAFLHSKGIVHRDLKTMNILLDNDDAAVIADFGLCGSLKENKDLTGGVGTPHYTAPEVLEHKHYDQKVDVYSYALILWEMATNSVPFRNRTNAEIFDHVVTHGRRLKMTSDITDSMKKLINRCWAENPNERPDFNEIVEDFATGKVYFKGASPVNDSKQLEAKSNTIPLNITYITKVLKDPTNANFPSVADFISKNMWEETRNALRENGVHTCYTAKSENPGSALLISSKLLNDDEYPEFIDKVALPLFNKLKDDEISLGIRFLMTIPKDLYPKIGKIMPTIVSIMNNDSIGGLVLQLISKIGEEAINKYKKEIIDYISPEKIEEINDQDTVTAIGIIVPVIIDDIKHKSRFIPFLESNFTLSSDFQRIIVQRISKKKVAKLLTAFIKSARNNESSKIICHLLNECSKEDLDEIAKNIEVYNDLDILIKENKSVIGALSALFVFTSVPGVPSLIANHKILFSLLDLKKYTAQRLQIFTSLFISHEFLENTTTSDGVLKLIISSINDAKLSTFALRLIGALSSYEAGCKAISDTGMLPLLIQQFLSPNCSDFNTSMTIISNISKYKQQIPQISLIISCLMQDLMCKTINRRKILGTLIDIVGNFSESIQESYLISHIMPLISPNQEPDIVLLALRLFNTLGVMQIKNFYKSLTANVFSMLQSQDLQFSEIITEATRLIIKISEYFDIKEEILDSDFMTFIQVVLSQIDKSDKIYDVIKGNIASLKTIIE